MEYKKIVEGVFLQRENRFSAYVLLEGKETHVHVKNTGRCKELLLPGARVLLEEADNPNRKTKYSLVAVYKGDLFINMDSQAPNAAGAEALTEGRILEIGAVDFLRREVKFGNSRFDLYYEKGEEKGFIEMKGVTLEEDGMARFPDAPTERGRKHLLELIEAKKAGYQATVLFLIQMKGVHYFTPHWIRDAAFGEALLLAAAAGVQILAYDAVVTREGMLLDGQVPVFLERQT